MKFSNILNTYIKESNINIDLVSNYDDTSILTFEHLLQEAKKSKADLYANLTITRAPRDITAEDVANTKFYIKGKSAKEGKEQGELDKINKHQADLFNKIFKRVKETAVDDKTTLAGLTAAAQQIFAIDKQNTPTQGYNMRAALTVLITTKKLLTPTEGGTINGGAVVMDPEEGNTEAPKESTPSAEISSEEEPSSKFDSAVKENEPEITTKSGENYKVEKGTKITKEEIQGSDRTLAAWLISLISNELPGTYNKQSLTAEARERDSEVTSEEISSMLDKLVKMGKIQMIKKQTNPDDQVYSQDEDESELDSSLSDEPEDLVDRQLTGSTRKGFNFDAFDN